MLRPGFWPIASNAGGTPALWASELKLGEPFFLHLPEHAVPLSGNAIRALSHSAIALDYYGLFAYRLHSLGQPLTLTWDQLREQIGQQRKATKDFKKESLPASRLCIASGYGWAWWWVGGSYQCAAAGLAMRRCRERCLRNLRTDPGDPGHRYDQSASTILRPSQPNNSCSSNSNSAGLAFSATAQSHQCRHTAQSRTIRRCRAGRGPSRW
jgi:hypothetical protein